MAGREPFNVTVRSSATAVATQRSPWHSPVPYLFGGLAAMLGLIAFALLILACSYWKLSGYLESNENGGERDLEAGEEGGKGDDTIQKGPPVFEEKILVIMAGDAKPTFLATPMSSRSSSFGDNSSSCSCSERSEKSAVEMSDRTVKEESGGKDRHQVLQGSENSESTTHEASDQRSVN